MINPVVSNIVVTIAKTKLILNMRFVHINPIKGYQSLPQHTVWQQMISISAQSIESISLGQISRNMSDFKCIHLLICLLIYKCVNKLSSILLIPCIPYLASKNYEGVQNYLPCFFTSHVLLKKVLNQLILETRVSSILHIYFLQ